MKLNTEPIKNWFGFSRRERRSSAVLVILLIIILMLRLAIPDKSIIVEDVTASVSDLRKVSGPREGTSEKPVPLVKVRTYPAKKEQIVLKKPQRKLIDLNSCDSALLVTLPGIGPVLSVRIIKYRKLLGGFASVNQLKEVYGLPPETFEIIKGKVFADTSAINVININTAGYKELSDIPYLENYEVKSILKYRELTGRISAIKDLTENKLITVEKAEKVKPYINFR
jgi:DNA uptake protein ComE-like DNA-binding protein